MSGEHYKRLSISLPGDLYEKFDRLRTRLNMSRSDAIRKAMNLFIIDNEQKSEIFENKNVVATIVYVEHSHVHGHPPEEMVEGNKNPPSDSTTESKQQPPKESHMKETPIDHHSRSEHEAQSRSSSSPYYIPVEKMEYIQATELQHDFLDVIQSTMHIHINADSCMEIIACKGRYERIKEFYDKMQQLKTIKKIELNVMEILD